MCFCYNDCTHLRIYNFIGDNDFHSTISNNDLHFIWYGWICFVFIFIHCFSSKGIQLIKYRCPWWLDEKIVRLVGELIYKIGTWSRTLNIFEIWYIWRIGMMNHFWLIVYKQFIKVYDYIKFSIFLIKLKI